jgi:hypothetical protein
MVATRTPLTGSRYDASSISSVPLLWKILLNTSKASLTDANRFPTFGLLATQHFALGAIFVYQLAFLYRFEHDQELCVGLKAA